MTLNVERLTPNGEIRSADLVASIAKRLRAFATPEFNGQVGFPANGRMEGCACLRGESLRKYAEQLEKLAKALEATP